MFCVYDRIFSEYSQYRDSVDVCVVSWDTLQKMCAGSRCCVCVVLSLSPSFFSYKTFLSEDAGPETLVAIVHAKDPDGDGVTYAITGGNEDSNFELDNQKGKLNQSV